MLRFSIWLGPLTHTISDLIILSDDESIGAESESNYSNLDIDLRAKSDSDSLHVADSELADGDGFGSGTIHTSGRLVADHPDDDNKNKNDTKALKFA
jgi:hypothetical protein